LSTINASIKINYSPLSHRYRPKIFSISFLVVGRGAWELSSILAPFTAFPVIIGRRIAGLHYCLIINKGFLNLI
jgi:hypothetical protein